MSDQDWTDEKNYDYADALSVEGWAWEFMRRGECYRDAYRHCVDEGFNLEQAGGGWALDELYPPNQKYDKNIIGFYKPIVPKFFLSEEDLVNQDVEDLYDLRSHIHTYNELRDEIIPQNQGEIVQVSSTRYRASEPDTSLRSFKKSNIVLVAFDLNYEPSLQLKRLNEFFQRYDPSNRDTVQPVRILKEWKLYLRMLDAYKSNGGSQAGIIQLIDPNKKFKLKKGALDEAGYDLVSYEQASYDQINNYASEVYTAAKEMAEGGYRKLIRAIQWGTRE